MVHKHSSELLAKLFRLEKERFISTKVGTSLDKHRQIFNCEAEITSFLETNVNCITTVTNEDNTMAVIVKNVKEKNDHTKYFLLTIDENFETFQVERINIPEDTITKTIIKKFR